MHNGQDSPVYYDIGMKIPLDNRCPHCGLHALLPHETIEIKPKPKIIIDDLDMRVRPGRRPKIRD